MPSGHGPVQQHGSCKKNGPLFDAPRPAVANRLGKKRTDELIQADGDTWQEYLAVCEKADTKNTNGAATRLSFFAKMNKKKNSKSASTTSNANANVNAPSNTNLLIIRSYFQNQRTGKKMWDEPPSGASNVVPASEEMRRMAEIQLDEVCVAASTSIDVDVDADADASNTGTGRKGKGDHKKKKTLVGGLNIFQRGRYPSFSSRNGNGNEKDNDKKGTMDGDASSTTSAKNAKRIRYKPGSSLATTGTVTSKSNTAGSKGQRNSGAPSSFNDRQLQQAIELSISQSHGSRFDVGVDRSNGNSNDSGNRVESEEETLRRVLEASRLEAIAMVSTKTKPPHNASNYVQKDIAKRNSRKTAESSTSTSTSSQPKTFRAHGNQNRGMHNNNNNHNNNNYDGKQPARKHPPPSVAATTKKSANVESFDPYGPTRKPSSTHKHDRRDPRQHQQQQQQGLLWGPASSSLPSTSRRQLQSSASGRDRISGQSGSNKKKHQNQAGIV